MDLAQRLGAFLGQVTDGNVETIQLFYSGRLAAEKTELIRNSAIAGVFGASESDSSVNSINAASIAQQRGIRISEDKSESGVPALSLTLHTRTGARSATGTLLHGHSPRLLGAHGIDIEAPLQGRLLCIRNYDTPGVIGRVGTILGEHGINIASFGLGRPHRHSSVFETNAAQFPEPAPPGVAFAVVQIEGVITPELLHQLRNLSAVISVRLVELPD